MNTESARRRDHILTASAPAWRTRRRRRALAVLTVLVVVANLVVAHLSFQQYLPLIGIVVGTLGFVALRVLTRGVADQSDGMLDEHDRALRDKVVRWSFVVAPVALILIAVYAGITQLMPDLSDRITNLAIIAAWASVGIPTLVLGWILPDDNPEDLA